MVAFRPRPTIIYSSNLITVFLMKVLVATEKPFAANAVKAIKEEIEKAGHELVLLEK